MSGDALPAINAVFNGISTVLLITGYVLIRRRRMRAHGMVMLGAVVSSSLFLAGYLTHKVILHGVDVKMSRFPHLPMLVKHIYWWVLLVPHLLLAVVMLPFIYLGLYHAYHRRFDRHRAINRITIWMWLYVSVTGVLIYYLLYHLFPALEPHATAATTTSL